MAITAINSPILKIGAQGAFVTELQQLLNLFDAKLVVDSSFGPATEKAVKAFQTKFAVPADGVVGHKTWNAIYERVFFSAPNAMPILRRGSVGEAVQLLQRNLNLLPNQPKLIVDGDFGMATEKAVKSLQKSEKLLVDGIVGSKTWMVVPGQSGC